MTMLLSIAVGKHWNGFREKKLMFVVGQPAHPISTPQSVSNYGAEIYKDN